MKKKKIVLMGATTPAGHHILVNSLLLGFEVIAITPLAHKISIKNKNLKVIESSLENFEAIRSLVNNSEVLINTSCFGHTIMKDNFSVLNNTANFS